MLISISRQLFLSSSILAMQFHSSILMNLYWKGIMFSYLWYWYFMPHHGDVILQQISLCKLLEHLSFNLWVINTDYIIIRLWGYGRKYLITEILRITVWLTGCSSPRHMNIVVSLTTLCHTIIIVGYFEEKFFTTWPNSTFQKFTCIIKNSYSDKCFSKYLAGKTFTNGNWFMKNFPLKNLLYSTHHPVKACILHDRTLFFTVLLTRVFYPQV